MNEKIKTAEEYAQEIYSFPPIGHKLFPSDLQKSIIIGYEYALQFKPKAGEVEKLREKFNEDCCFINKNNESSRINLEPEQVFQWIQDNCLSQSNEVKASDTEALQNRVRILERLLDKYRPDSDKQIDLNEVK